MLDIFKRLFGRSGPAVPKPDPSEAVNAVLADMRAQSRRCLRLASGGSGRSRLGGSASTTGPWPRHQGRPLSLIAQLDLAEMRAAGGPDWLPADGRLLFFYDLELASWGMEPNDRGSALVRYETQPAEDAVEPDDLSEDLRLEARPVTFTPDVSPPSEERLGVDWKSLSQKQVRDLEAAVESLLPSEPTHQVGGYPIAVQGDDMEEQCQGMTRGLPAAGSSAADWRLLLQLDTDGEAEMMWGDTGRLYCWIREQDARQGDFSKTWTIVQSY
jgi:uncharacterized protein YwqG